NPRPPQTNAIDAHQRSRIPTTPSSATPCLSCHDGRTATLFLLGGTVQYPSGGAVANAEVRAIDSKGKEIAHTKSDANGNFWVKGGDQGAPPPIAGAVVGVRNATRTDVMGEALGRGDCNGCHGASQAAIEP